MKLRGASGPALPGRSRSRRPRPRRRRAARSSPHLHRKAFPIFRSDCRPSMTPPVGSAETGARLRTAPLSRRFPTRAGRSKASRVAASAPGGSAIGLYCASTATDSWRASIRKRSYWSGRVVRVPCLRGVSHGESLPLAPPNPSGTVCTPESCFPGVCCLDDGGVHVLHPRGLRERWRKFRPRRLGITSNIRPGSSPEAEIHERL